ncbi:MAG: tetratricopeptide repeat protein, partial [Flavobacteriales bacterium]|nr:tetratricopeptide repeat protein [Flavobacteriales bacterium]
GKWQDFLKIWETTVDQHYSPITYSSYAFDYFLFGLEPRAFHCTNIFIHLVNTALLFRLSQFLRTKAVIRSFAVLLFSVNPIGLEAVAWISSRNYLLAAFFILLTTLSFIKYIREGKSIFLFFSVLTFACSLLAGRMYIMFPFVMFLGLIRFGATAKWKSLIPLFIIALAYGVLSLYLVSELDQPQAAVGFVDGLYHAFYGLCFNIVRFFVPIIPGIYHAIPEYSIWFIISGTLLMLILTIASIFRKQIAFGFLIFLILIFITLKFSFLDYYGAYVTADRYLYLPSIGLIIAIFYLSKRVIWLPLLVITFGVASYSYSMNWRNSGTIWEQVLKHYPENAYAHNNLGNYLVKLNDYDKAGLHFQRALHLDELYAQPRINYGNLLLLQKQVDSAIFYYDASLVLDPGNLALIQNRGMAHFMNEDYLKSYSDFRTIYERDPNFTNAKKLLVKSIKALPSNNAVDSLELMRYLKECSIE